MLQAQISLGFIADLSIKFESIYSIQTLKSKPKIELVEFFFLSAPDSTVLALGVSRSVFDRD